MRQEREQEQPRGIFADVVRVMEALGDEIAHDRAGDATDQMHQQRQRCARIAGEDGPRDVVDRHGQYGDQLDRVGIQKAVLCDGHDDPSCQNDPAALDRAGRPE